MHYYKISASLCFGTNIESRYPQSVHQHFLLPSDELSIIVEAKPLGSPPSFPFCTQIGSRNDNAALS